MFGYLLSQLLVNSLYVTFDDQNCTTYLSMGNGEWQQVTLRNVGYIELMLMNTTGNYILYSFPDTKIETFDWITKSINGHPMEVKHSKGIVNPVLDRVTFFCPIKGVVEAKLKSPMLDTSKPVLECRWEDKTVVSTLASLIILILLSLVFGHKLPDAIKAFRLFMTNQNYQAPSEQISTTL